VRIVGRTLAFALARLICYCWCIASPRLLLLYTDLSPVRRGAGTFDPKLLGAKVGWTSAPPNVDPFGRHSKQTRTANRLTL
jgi:hypothetical protein